MNTDVIERLLALYQQIDEETTAFQAVTGLQCPADCGRCCENPEIEATPLEMLPLAIELLRQGKAQQWLERLAALNERSVCVFYQSDPLIPGNGRCGVYAGRPAVCRLFGYATVKNKQGTPELAACRHHKQTVPAAVEIAKAAIIAGVPAPNFSDYGNEIANLDPNLGQMQMPLNQALKIALERVGLIAQFGGE
ncbi:MAG: YkgJ family cysteine cluster protein [Microcoleus vaginatus WJT46-NPBG5]|jgi:Fe-S-cluster containining protein|nr:YkgJ family cysteine cluster protein [Microcoleus vaginatus WJT46-NPBG5]